MNETMNKTQIHYSLFNIQNSERSSAPARVMMNFWLRILFVNIRAFRGKKRTTKDTKNTKDVVLYRISQCPGKSTSHSLSHYIGGAERFGLEMVALLIVIQ